MAELFTGDAKPNDLVQRARDWLRGNGFKCLSIKRLDASTGKTGIVLRRLPTTITDRYYNGGTASEFIYQAICRSMDEEEAMLACEAVAQALVDAPLESENGSFRLLGQEVYTAPQELQLDEANYYAYEVRIRAYIA